MSRAKAKKKNTSQPARFIEAARELGCNEDEAAFDDKLRRIAQAKSEKEKDPDK